MRSPSQTWATPLPFQVPPRPQVQTQPGLWPVASKAGGASLSWLSFSPSTPTPAVAVNADLPETLFCKPHYKGDFPLSPFFLNVVAFLRSFLKCGGEPCLSFLHTPPPQEMRGPAFFH